MACTPSFCSGNCYSYGCAGPYAVACPSNATNFGSTLITGDTILAEHINALRISVDNERTSRRGLSADFPTYVDSDDLVEAQHADDLKDSINEMVAQTGDSVTGDITTTYVVGDSILASHVNELRTKINELRQDCVCNTDCGANLVCVCHGNCGNNYGILISDKRLKKDIIYM